MRRRQGQSHALAGQPGIDPGVGGDDLSKAEAEPACDVEQGIVIGGHIMADFANDIRVDRCAGRCGKCARRTA